MDGRPMYIWTTCPWCRYMPAGHLPDGTAVCLLHYQRWTVAWFADLCEDPLAAEALLQQLLQQREPRSVRDLAIRCEVGARRSVATLVELEGLGLVESLDGGVPRPFRLSSTALRGLLAEDAYLPARYLRSR